MEEITAYKFYWLGRILSKFKRHHDSLSPDQELTAGERNTVRESMEIAHALCKELGLSFSASTVQRLVFETRDTSPFPFTHRNVVQWIDDAEHRIADEMRSASFLFVKPDHVEFYKQDEPLFGPEVSIAFPTAILDIEEAGKSFALNRYTACVFHLQRAMETTLTVFAANVGVPPQSNPSWGSILGKIDAELKLRFPDRSPEFNAQKDFYLEAAAMLRIVKDAWRNPTMHVDKIYDEERAKEILDAVKSFMRKLANGGLHE
jgi:HEPN domain-containing protein